MFADLDIACRRDHILAGERGIDHFRGNAELGNAFTRHFHIYPLVLNAEEGDIGHILDQEEFPPEYLGVLVNLTVGKTVTVNGIENAVHIAEIVPYQG